jgi:predicted transcriptional regulator
MSKFFIGLLITAAASWAYPAVPVPADSSKAVTGIQWEILPLFPRQDSLGINFELVAPSASEEKLPFYDPKNVMPANRLFLDYRGSSYYVPRQVNNQLAHIMNRPSPDAFVPVLAVAYLAAKLALQAVQIKKMVTVDTSAYLLNSKKFKILQLLWKQSPQTAAQLYRNREIQSNRTFTNLQTDLDRLLEAKLIKIKHQEKAPPLYFAAQKGTIVRKLLNEALLRNNWNTDRRNRAKQLLQLDWGWEK